MLWIVVKAETHTWFKGSVINESHTPSAARLMDHSRKSIRVEIWENQSRTGSSGNNRAAALTSSWQLCRSLHKMEPVNILVWCVRVCMCDGPKL